MWPGEVPANVSFFLAHLSKQIEENRHCSCATEQRSSAVSPRVDAQASESRTGLGGWLPVLDQNGTPDPWRSPWFSIEVTEEEWPWVHEKGGRPAPIISTLEALAVLIPLRLSFGGTANQHRSKIMVAPTWTDNRSNGSALNKLMSTKFSTNAVLMELATYTKKMELKVLVEWTPRAGNREAGALANGDSSLFDPRRRFHFERDFQWEVLDSALRMGREVEAETAAARAEKRLPDRTSQRKKKRASRLRNCVLLTHGDLPWSLVELFSSFTHNHPITRLSESQTSISLFLLALARSFLSTSISHRFFFKTVLLCKSLCLA